MNRKEFCHYCERLFAAKLMTSEQFHWAMEGSKEIFDEDELIPTKGKIDTTLGFPRLIEDTDED